MFKGSKNCQVVSERVALLLLILWSLSWSLTPLVWIFGNSFCLFINLLALCICPLLSLLNLSLNIFFLIICGNNYLCYTALTTLKARDSCLWYLDSGCFRHMTGNKWLFKTLFEGKIGTVTFGDGSKSVIRGIGTVDIPGLLGFEDVWYVDGLKANLLNISQICDNGLNVQIGRASCRERVLMSV